MKQSVCKHCGGVDTHFSFQCHTQRKPIKQTVSNKPLQSNKTSKPISPISNKRKEALKRYRRLIDKYFLDHPVCEYPDCSSTNITLHHQRGRIGAFLTDNRYFKSLCGKHHRWVEENPTEAIKIGLSIKRLDKHK